MKFKKMHGLGNDFVIFDARAQNIVLMPEDMALIADRHWGVGCDQLVIMDESEKADIAVFFFNADGSESGACGNATRCVADIIMSESGNDACTIEAIGGILECKKVAEQLVQVDMGVAKGVSDLDLSYGGVSNPVSVDMGNPHCVFFVDNFDDISVEEVGTYFENHEAFPNRSNVEFVVVENKTHLRQKTWERGVGITEACGSGACAVGVAAMHRGLSDNKVEIELDGGLLQIELDDDQHVLMTGPVAYVFDGAFQSE
jgi:diaminopimelate epimerase